MKILRIFLALAVGVSPALAQTAVTINSASKQLQPTVPNIVVGNGQSITATGTGVIGATSFSGILAGASGGTGIANTGKTITLGGNLATSGAFNTTITVTGTTAVTLPTSGILTSTSDIRVIRTSWTCVSDAGTLLNATLANGQSFAGVTDQTAALQAILNQAQTNPIYVIWDGAYSTTGLTIYSNTHILALPGCGALLRSYGTGSTTYFPIFGNANPGTGTIVDKNIIIDGGIWNGNALNQPHDTTAQGWSVGFRLMGVQNVQLRNLTIFDSRTFAIHFANWQNVDCRNITINQHGSVGVILNNQDGIHFNGPGSFAVVDGLNAYCNDDSLAINPDDGQVGGASPFGPFAGPGAITNVQASNIFLNNSDNGGNSGIRILSGATLADKIVISGVTGSTHRQVVIIDNYSEAPSALVTAGVGNIGSVTIENMDVNLVGSVDYKASVIYVSAVVANLKLSGVRRNPTVAVPWLKLDSGALIQNLVTKLEQFGAVNAPAFQAASGASFQNWDAQVQFRGGAGVLTSYSVFDITSPAANSVLRVHDSQLINVPGIVTTKTSGTLLLGLTDIDYYSDTSAALILPGASTTITSPATNVGTNGAALTGGAGTNSTRTASDKVNNLTVTGTLVGSAPAGSLTGTTLASNVVTSSLSSVGTLTSGALGSGFTAIANARLANSTTTIGSTAVALGSTITDMPGMNSMTAAASTNATITGGSSGASIVLGQGSTTTSGVATINSTYSAAGGAPILNILAPSKPTNATVTNGIFTVLGIAASSKNSLVTQFGYVGSGNTTNMAGFGLYGTPAPLWITGNDNILIGTTTDNGTDKLQITGTARVSSTLKAAGGIVVGAGTTMTKFGMSTPVALVAGTTVISDSTITANSRIVPLMITPGGTVGALFVPVKTASTGFTITSSSALDTSTVSAIIIEP